MEENEKGHVHIMYLCVDTEKRETSLVSAGQKKEQPLKGNKWMDIFFP